MISVFFGAIGVTASSVGLARSLSEISASASGIGHAMAAVGSPRSRAGYAVAGRQCSLTR
jgi:hypothetical protein